MSQVDGTVQVNRRKLSEIVKNFKKLFGVGARIPLQDDMIEMVFEKMDLDDRIRMGFISRQTLNVVEQMPLILPLVVFRSDINGNFEIHTDNLDILTGFILDECPGYRICGGDRIVFSDVHSHIVMNRILSKISGISQLWLETANNERIAQLITNFYREVNREGQVRRFKVEQLTVIGKSTRKCDIHSVAQLIILCRKTLEVVRFRNSRITDEREATVFWSSIGQCLSLRMLQYEPVRLDKHSRPFIIKALKGKHILSLIMTGVHDFSTDDVVKVASTSGTITELAVVSQEITPRSYYTTAKAKKIINNLQTLLIQLDTSFTIDDDKTRKHIGYILEALPKTGILEVIHVNHEAPPDITRTLSYWLRLAHDSERTIKLKLEDCSQDRQDAAVGRLMRKSKDSFKSGYSSCGTVLSWNNCGSVVLLNKNTWFGDDE